MVCPRIDTKSFLQALQIHIFRFGLMKLIVSDQGSPIVAGVERTLKLLDDVETKAYLEQHNIRSVQFLPYPANASHLGGLVENIVKQVKRLITGSIRNNILSLPDFQFLMEQINMLINKRPVAFKESIYKLDINDPIITPITPEMILRGYDVPCVNIVPQMQTEEMKDPNWEISDESSNTTALRKSYEKLSKVKNNMKSLYQEEFTKQLFHQATDRKDRYKPVHHNTLGVGDIVSIKQKLSKPYNFPLGVIVSIEKNDLDEVVSAIIRKSNNEQVSRHASDLILLFKSDPVSILNEDTEVHSEVTLASAPKSKRAAAKKCTVKNETLAQQNLI